MKTELHSFPTSQLSKAETTGEGKVITDKAVSEVAGQSAVLLRSLKLLQHISDEWNPSADTPENFLRDLTELGLAPSTKARKFLLDLLTEVERDNLRRLEKDYANALLPSYIGTYTVVDFRAVVQRPFGSGLQDKIEEYEPGILSFVPVVVVRIRRDSGDPMTFEFQCEERPLRRLPDALEAALKDLEAAKLSFPRQEDLL